MTRARIPYSDQELAWIKACSDLPRKDLHSLFVQIFRRSDVTADHLKALCSRKGWAAGPEGRRRLKGTCRAFSEEEVAWLRANAGLSQKEAAQAFQDRFNRPEVTEAKIISWRKRNRVKTGRDGRFQKGNVPHTLGRKGWVAPGAEVGWFSKGQKPHNARPIGYERVNRDGYVMICVDRPNPFRPQFPTHMAFKHRELWEAKNGPVPEGHALKCLDGNKLNTDPSNWEAVPKGLLPRLNGKSRRDYDTAPAEVKPTILAIAKLEHRAHELRKRKAEALTTRGQA